MMRFPMVLLSAAPQAIKDAIIEQMGRTVTVYQGRGGKSGEDRDILYCVITRLEIGRRGHRLPQCGRPLVDQGQQLRKRRGDGHADGLSPGYDNQTSSSSAELHGSTAARRSEVRR